MNNHTSPIKSEKVPTNLLVMALLAILLLVTLLVGIQVPTARADGIPSWTFVTIPDIPEGARPRKLWSDRPDNLYVWVERSGTDPTDHIVILYHWDGLNWNEELSFPGYISANILGTGPDDIFVSISCPEVTGCTGYEQTRMFHFDGTSWIEQVLPPEVGRHILSIGGVPGEVQAVAYQYPAGQEIIIRYDYGSATWSKIFTAPEGARNLTVISANEAYYETCWGHGRWDGSAWTYKHEFDFCDLHGIWGIRDDSGALHLYVAGTNNFAIGVRVWKYTENADPILLGTFGSKYGYVFADPVNGSYNIGSAYGLWGSAADDVYAVGRVGDYNLNDSGRAYHFDGVSWQQLTAFGAIPPAIQVGGSGPDNVWISLRDGRMLHYSVPNRPPELTVENSTVTVDEGQEALNSGAISDLDGDTVELSASVGTIVNNDNDTWSWNFTSKDGPDESQMVIIDANDGKGGLAQTSFLLTVENVAPTIEAITLPLEPVNIAAQPVSVGATFTDPAGAEDETYTCTIDYGDGGVPSVGSISGLFCSGPHHTYAEPGVYQVTVLVADKDGGQHATESTSAIVIYDPSGGFVTGGGWIWSEAGACRTDDRCTKAKGKANFGFVSKYKMGAEVPTGNIEFNFRVGDLNFHSDEYQWLVVNQGATNAQFAGSGTLLDGPASNHGVYKFMVWAKDGDPVHGDTFRIRIWSEDNDSETVVYDNGFDQPIGSGNIAVHSKSR